MSCWIRKGSFQTCNNVSNFLQCNDATLTLAFIRITEIAKPFFKRGGFTGDCVLLAVKCIFYVSTVHNLFKILIHLLIH